MIEFIPSASRGGGDYGWLKTKYSFSFADYYDPMKRGFGALRVINDDWIAPQSGFGEHHHANMEIITIPYIGRLSHRDSTGGEGSIGAGEVQVMSAGTGVTHSEYNHDDKPIELFQIWIEPKIQGIAPHYDQKPFNFDPAQNKMVLVVSPDGRDGSLTIHQNALIFRGVYQEAKKEGYQITLGNGIYLIMRAGEVQAGEHTLHKGDALSVSKETFLELDIFPGSDFVILEIPPLQHVL